MVLDRFSVNKPNFPSKAAVVIDGGYWRKVVEHLDLKYVDLVALDAADELTTSYL